MKIKASKNYDYNLVRQEAKAKIDKQAELLRQQSSATGVLQTAVYRAKLEEAKSFSSSESFEETDYPLLMGEVGITASDINGVAKLILMKEKNWRKSMAKIESVRIARKKMIDLAPDDFNHIEQIVGNTTFL